MTLCFESDDDETNEGPSVPLKRDDSVLIILKALQVNMGDRQILHLTEEMRESIIVAIRQVELYVDKLKDAPLTRSPTQCATYNVAITFTDDDLLLGSKPHNRSLFVIGYIRRQMVI